MAIPVYLTVDLFHYYWDDTQNRQLWLAVNANILPYEDDVAGWIKNSATGRDGFDYTLVRSDTVLDPEIVKQMVTVNLPDDVNVRLTAFDAGGNVIFDSTNDRRTAVHIQDGDAFARDNLDLRNIKPTDRIEPIQPLPFAAAFNRMARNALAGETDIIDADNPPARQPVPWEQLRAMIDVTQAGGSRRRLRNGVADHVNRIDLMALNPPTEPEPGAVTVTNLHSLNGLMFKLADAVGIPSLASVRNLRIVLDDGGATPLATFNLDDKEDDRVFLEGFFGGLGGNLSYDQLTASWLGDLARRVYVSDTAMVFAHRAEADGTHWYRRRRESGDGETAAANQLFLSDIKRILVKYRPVGDNDDPPDVPQIGWQAHGSFECELARYREFPTTGAHGTVMRLTPRRVDALNFYSELESNPTMLGGVTVYGEEGNALDIDLLGVFNLEWDQTLAESRPTILFLGQVPTNANVTVVYPCRTPNGDDVVLTTAREWIVDGPEGDNRVEAFWEVSPGPELPKKRFHSLKLTNALSTEHAGKLIVAVSFIGDVEFVYAQAGGCVEVGIQTRVANSPDPVPGSPPSSVADEFLDDLKNFNCLNVYETWGNRGPMHLNPRREDYPVHVSKPEGETLYTYHVRFEEPTYPDPEQGAVSFDARAFYSELYDRIGTDRSLNFDVEHTFGTHINMLDIDGVSADFDFPIITPADVGNGSKPRRNFVEVEYFNDTDKDSELALLHFDLSFLRAVDPASDEAVTANINAWRAVAEMAKAARIPLLIRFRRFDLVQALTGAIDNSLGGALAPVEGLEDREEDVTALLRTLAAVWLGGDLRNAGPIEIPLTGPGEPKIFETCNVLDFRLGIERDARSVPDTDASWVLARQLQPTERDSEIFGVNGQIVDLVTPGDAEYALVRARFNYFNQRLKSRIAALQPHQDSEAEGAELVRRILGGSGQASTADWLVPEGAIEGAGGDAEVEFLPVGLQPIKRHHFLGAETQKVLRRLFEAYETVIEGRIAKIADWDKAAMIAFFDGLQSANLAFKTPVGINQTPYRNLILKLVDLALPLPDPNDGNLEPRIKPLVDAGRTVGHDLRAAQTEWLYNIFASEPGRFYAAKALLYSRLRGTVSGSAVSPDLFKFETDKIIRKAGTTILAEKDSITVQDSLRALVGTDWFGFMEVLDDTEYDNDFSISCVRLKTFESVVDSFAKAEDTAVGPELGALQIKIFDDTVYVPTGPQELNDSKAAQQTIHLASRKPVSDPVLLFAGKIKPCQTTQSLKCYVGCALDQEAFLSGRIKYADPQSTAVVTIQDSPVFQNRSTRRDDVTVSLIYAVGADEESQTSWTNAIKHDTFFVEISREPPNSMPSSAMTRTDPPGYLAALLGELAQESDVASIDGIEQILKPEALDYTSDIIEPAGGASIDLNWNVMFDIIEDIPNQKIGIKRRKSRFNGAAEFFLLRPNDGDPAPANVDAARFYILINLEIPVWQPTAMILQQTRNFKLLGGEGFAPEFGLVSEKIATDAPFSTVEVVNNLYDDSSINTVPLRRDGDYSALDLVTMLLIDDIKVLLPPSDSEPDWLDFDLSVTVYGDQVTTMPQARFDAGGALRDDTMYSTSSKHGRRQHFFAVDGFAESFDDWFDEEYEYFTVEFQWSTRSNLPLFRVEGRRVKIFD